MVIEASHWLALATLMATVTYVGDIMVIDHLVIRYVMSATVPRQHWLLSGHWSPRTLNTHHQASPVIGLAHVIRHTLVVTRWLQY